MTPSASKATNSISASIQSPPAPALAYPDITPPSVDQHYTKKFQPVWRRDESWRFEAHPIVAYKDKLIFQEQGSDLLKSTIYVLDEHGIKIVYEESINDMLQL